ncbi:hypothetical protein SLEP1_g49564 [Rubroshorea leprosula]|uniref:Uncharacterized protein n=1 Tax=Rubroshorea leprosula TaxID=152421 RepID=A0AAV5LY59_9ROSI|nr:hypothetical protein SLEP1_g49564 [Rubroshorea leprosula]
MKMKEVKLVTSMDYLAKLRRCLQACLSLTTFLQRGAWVDRLTRMLSRLENVFKELDAFYQQLIDDHLDPKRQKPEQEDIIPV